MTGELQLHMVRLELLPRRLIALARDRRLPIRDIDDGYLIHCALREIFRTAAPQPFSVSDVRSGSTTILGYCDHPEEYLRSIASASSNRAAGMLRAMETIMTKPLPSQWMSGRVYRFHVRICPIVRLSSATAGFSKGAEIDAFLHAVSKSEAGKTVAREDVYLDWLGKQLHSSGADMQSARIDSFRLSRFARRTHDAHRKARLVERPDVRVSGQLRVREPGAFGRMIRQGIGRHRAFGFGMVLLARE